MANRRDFGTVVVGLGACLLASQVHAFALTDTSIQDAAGAFVSPSALSSGKGKPRKEHINDLTGLFAGDAWSLLDRTNKPAESFNDVLFMLSADTHRRSGGWELNWDKPEFSPNMDLIILLKGGKQWGAYLFQAGGISPDARTLAGDFEISWVNKKGKAPKLRYASIYGRMAHLPVDTSPDQTDTSPDLTDTSPDLTDTSPDQTDTAPDLTDTSPDQTDTSPDQTDTSPDLTDTSPVNTDSSTVANDNPDVVTTTPEIQNDVWAVPDPSSIPTPGSLALFTMSLGLALRQLRQKN